jgi:hypothetical protein
MKVRHVLPLVAGLMLGASNLAFAAEHSFIINDKPGNWFDAGPGWNLGSGQSLMVVSSGDKVHFIQNDPTRKVESNHTITNLVWPTAANGPVGPMGIQEAANMRDHEVTLTTPGLYVWVCKLHPYMLGAVIVDDPNTKNAAGGVSYDLGTPAGWATQAAPAGSLTMLGTAGGTLTFKDTDDVAARLLRAFFIVTNPSNWKDYTKANGVNTYQPFYPKGVPVHANSGPVSVDLQGYLLGPFKSVPTLFE